MTQKVSWREARELLTGAAGDGLVGANQAQQILDDLARFPETTQFYRNADSQGYLSYAGTDPGDQPQYLKVERKL
jgi:hypothetical protein